MRTPTLGHRPILLGIATLLGLGLAWPAPADATVLLPTGHRRHEHYGNGRHNLNTFSIRSPTWIRGVQNASNSNTGSSDRAQNAYCKRKRYCRITQIYQLH